jgi:PAS domain S-box-containing protein
LRWEMKIFILLITSAIFIYDLYTPTGMAGSLFYFIPVALAGIYADKRFSIAFTSFVTILIVAGFFVSAPGGSLLRGEINGSIAIAAGWAMVLVLIQRKTMMSELAGTAQKLSVMIDSSPLAMFALDPEGRVLSWNRAAEDIFGYKKEEALGMPLPTVPDENLDDFQETIRGSFEGNIVRNKEVRRKRKDGVMLDILVSNAPLKDEAGKISGGVWIATDITDRKRAETEVLELQERLYRESKELFNVVFINSMDAVILASEDGKILEANPAACRLFGYECNELLKKTRDDVVDLEDPRYQELMRLRERTGKVMGELRYVRKDGSKFEGEMASAVFPVDGNRMVSVIIRDITERKQLESDREDFAAMVTHDLKSPLVSIIGYSELLLLKDKVDEAEAKNMLNIIKQSGEEVVGMVNDYLTVYKAGAGKLELNVFPQDIKELLGEVEEEFNAMAEKEGIKLKFSLAEAPKVEADGKLVGRAVSNLVQNAINHTPSGGSITVSLNSSERRITISVSDTGFGIKPEERGKIFQRHYRSLKTAGTKGAGLGLAIVKAAAEAHGGWVEFESEPGKGSTFRLILPIKQEKAAA